MTLADRFGWSSVASGGLFTCGPAIRGLGPPARRLLARGPSGGHLVVSSAIVLSPAATCCCLLRFCFCFCFCFDFCFSFVALPAATCRLAAPIVARRQAASRFWCSSRRSAPTTCDTRPALMFMATGARTCCSSYFRRPAEPKRDTRTRQTTLRASLAGHFVVARSLRLGLAQLRDRLDWSRAEWPKEFAKRNWRAEWPACGGQSGAESGLRQELGGGVVLSIPSACELSRPEWAASRAVGWTGSDLLAGRLQPVRSPAPFTLAVLAFLTSAAGEPLGAGRLRVRVRRARPVAARGTAAQKTIELACAHFRRRTKSGHNKGPARPTLRPAAIGRSATGCRSPAEILFH